MDVVWILRENKTNNLELLFSIRSVVANLGEFDPQEDTIYIVGHKPKWLNYTTERPYRCVHVPCSEDADDITSGTKYQNVAKKYQIILNNEEISEDFIFMHDDIFILKKINTIKAYSNCSIKDHLQMQRFNFGSNTYYKILEPVYEKFPEGYSFETHTPCVFNKKKFKNFLKEFPFGQKGAKRSLYMNYYGMKPEKIPGVENQGKKSQDCKIFNAKQFFQREKDIKLKRSILSISDRIALFRPVRFFLRTRFFRPTPYEIHKFSPDSIFGYRL